MIERFAIKLIEQSLDELKFKNVAIVVPLTITKLDNICRSLFGSKGIIIDLTAEATAADVAAQFTNAEDDGVIILKNVTRLEHEKLYFLTQMLAERELSLRVDGQPDPIRIPISSCPVIALLEGLDDLSVDLSKYCNFRIDISSGELPEPLAMSDQDADEYAGSGNHDRDDNSCDLIRSFEIYEWQDGGRNPDIDSDLLRIRSVVFNPDEDHDPTPVTYQQGVLLVCRFYLNYLAKAYGYCEDIESDICSILTSKQGAYKDLLLDIYNQHESSFGDSDESARKSAQEFLNDDNCYVSFGTLEQYMNDQPLSVRREFLYRILVLFDAREPGVINVETAQIDLSIPTHIDLRDRIFELMESVCWKLQINSTRLNETRSGDEGDEGYEDNEGDERSRQDNWELNDNSKSEETEQAGLNVVFNIRVANAVTGREEENIEADFKVDLSDGLTVKKVYEFASTQSPESFCYLVYNFICRAEEELALGKIDMRYIDQFKDTRELA